MDEKWHILRTDHLMSDGWIDLRADHCRTPSGVDIKPYYVLSYPDWVNIVAVTPERSLVLVRQYRHAAEAFFMELPGGGVDPVDADIEQAARRELQEETGFTADRFIFVTSLHPNPSSQTNRVHTYLALNAVPTGKQALDAGEDGLTVHLLPIAEVLSGLPSGLLGQSMHVASVFLALRMAGLLQAEEPGADGFVAGAI